MSLVTSKTLMKIVLVISLALNLLIIGSFAGARLSDKGDGRKSEMRDRTGPRVDPGGLGIYGRALEGEDRRAIGRTLRASRADRQAERAELRALVLKVSESLRREPFDTSELNAIFDAHDAIASSARAEVKLILIDRLEEMGADKRRAYADRLVAIVTPREK